MSLEGIADLPLHDGHVPPWLIRIMERLAKAILEIMVDEFGPDKVIERLANPLWFQALNNVIGMDWDSSGSTTVTLGILKKITWGKPELGIVILGGKGANARKVPEEIPKALRLLRLSTDNGVNYENISRLVAKIDTALLQDGYTLYHHSLILSESGKWAIVQQGMNVDKRMARRYHWKYDTKFYEDPHEAIAGIKHERVLNLVSRDARKAQKTILDLARENPSSVVREYSQILSSALGQKTIVEYITGTQTGLIKIDKNKKITYYSPLPTPEYLLRKLRTLREAYPKDLNELLLVKGVGSYVIRALALISDLIYNEPPSWNDPVTTPYDPFKYAYAIGGKDGVPYRVNRRQAEEVVITLENIISRAKIDGKERYMALKRLRRLSEKISIKI